MPHEVSDGPGSDDLESHVEVLVNSKGRIGSHTFYRKGPVKSLLPRNDAEKPPDESTSSSTGLDTGFDPSTRTLSNEVQPVNVCDFWLHF